jgi:hypothetical protein
VREFDFWEKRSEYPSTAQRGVTAAAPRPQPLHLASHCYEGGSRAARGGDSAAKKVSSEL